MDRRENLKLIMAGTLASSLVWTGCSTETKVVQAPVKTYIPPYARTDEELKILREIDEFTFFNEFEIAKLNVLVDIIIPSDETSPGAKEAGVVDFLEFIMKDQPDNQTLMRGGLMWLDFTADEAYGKSFLEITPGNQTQILDMIAYPDTAQPQFQNAVLFFNLLRNLTATGYFTSQAGIKYMGYQGNTPNIWNGVPEEVMNKHRLSLDSKYFDVYLKPEERDIVAQWDDNGNLTT